MRDDPDEGQDTSSAGLEERPSGVNSVEIGLSLMGPLLDSGTPLTLKAISEVSGFTPPKAHRYLVSLMRAGLLEREPDTSRYRLGPLAVRLGFAALGMLDRDALGRRAMVDLCSVTNVTACLVMWADKGAIVMAVEPGPGTIFTGLRIGSHLPLLGSATGRLFLAYLPPNKTRQHLLLEGGSAEDRTLQAELAEIRASGVSCIRDAVMVGMSGLAAPVFDHDGNVHCALTLVFQSVLMDRANSLAQELKLAAAHLSQRLGFNDQTAESTAERQKVTRSGQSSRAANPATSK